MSTSASASAEKEKEKKKLSDKDLDLSNASRGVWLVKVPKYIAERWESGGAKDVGKLKIVRKANMKPQVSFSMSEALTVAMPNNPDVEQKTAITKEHNFMVSNIASQSLAVFSVTAGDQSATPPVADKLSLEGKVVQRAECRPVNDKSYMTLKKDSFKRAIEPTRKALSLKSPVVTYKPKSNHASNVAYDRLKKSEGKKSRDDKEIVMEMLFKLFEKHQYYKINDLVKATRQPVTYLKQILNEVCDYNVKNPHKNMWELKEEYRHYKKEEEDKPEETADKMDESSDDD